MMVDAALNPYIQIVRWGEVVLVCPDSHDIWCTVSIIDISVRPMYIMYDVRMLICNIWCKYIIPSYIHRWWINKLLDMVDI